MQKASIGDMPYPLRSKFICITVSETACRTSAIGYGDCSISFGTGKKSPQPIQFNPSPDGPAFGRFLSRYSRLAKIPMASGNSCALRHHPSLREPCGSKHLFQPLDILKPIRKPYFQINPGVGFKKPREYRGHYMIS